MAEGFITRRGGVSAEKTLNPSINFVSKGGFEIVVTFTNNDSTQADVFYGITSTLTDKVTVAASGTSSNVTFSGLDPNTPYTVSAYAIVTDSTLKKIKSEIISTSITTDDIQYTAATGGTTLEYNDGGKRYKSHTFTSSENFVVNQVGNGDRNQIDYLIIAGGGGGARANTGASGGGGAGGFLSTVNPIPNNQNPQSKITVSQTSYGVIVGSGGSGRSSTGAGTSGQNSSVFGQTAIGGGGGGGLNGGSGGGRSQAGAGSGIINQGNDGSNNSVNSGAGGGGAGQPGNDNNGGNGLSNTLRNGTSEIRAGGGGGGNLGSGGTGGGGDSFQSGQPNTGGGGGGTHGGGTSGNGGSGIVIIRYEIAPSA